jgi:hypothetical protein
MDMKPPVAGRKTLKVGTIPPAFRKKPIAKPVLAEAPLRNASEKAALPDPAPDYSRRAIYPHFSRPPLRIQALEVLRGHIEGYAPDYTETDLKNAIEILKYDKDREVGSVLAHVASSSHFESVKVKAREVLLDF